MAVTVGLFVRLEAASGREGDLADFLRGAEAVVRDEPGTTVWYALQFGPSTFGIFDAFEEESGREAHLNGQVARRSARTPTCSPSRPRSSRWTCWPASDAGGLPAARRDNR